MLKTNYKDDVFAGSRKYTTSMNADGTLSLTDVTVYQQEGDSFGAHDINDTNKAVNNLSEAVEETKKSVADGKTKVAKAISDKGQATAANATFDKMAENIGKIETGVKTDDATATAARILSGYTAYVKGVKLSGSMVNRGAISVSVP